MSSSPAQTDRPTIAAHAIASGYSGIEVLHGLDFTINHEVFAVLGANGAGKTTLIKTIAKVLPLISGRMEYSEHDITRMPPYTLAAHGLAYVPQEANTFRDMTVAENLAVGALIGSRPAAEKLMRFSPPNEFGVLDHDVSVQSQETRNAMRVVPNGSGAEVMFTLLKMPGMTEETFAADAAAVERDLNTLKGLLER
jgi:ABC-type branched-subunit amino acid transport system ATPase component